MLAYLIFAKDHQPDPLFQLSQIMYWLRILILLILFKTIHLLPTLLDYFIDLLLRILSKDRSESVVIDDIGDHTHDLDWV